MRLVGMTTTRHAPASILTGLLALFILVGVVPVHGADLPNYELTLHNGTLTPVTLHVKAGEPFKITLHNTGNTPAEFESHSLHREKVLAPGVKSFVFINALPPGEYDFFDEFHLPDARGTLIAQ